MKGTFLVHLSHEIDGITNHFVFDGYQALAAYLKAPLASLLILYLILLGYAFVRGIVQMPQQELFKFVLRAGVIYTLGMDWNFFATHIRDLLVVSSEGIASTLMNAAHSQMTPSSISGGLQQVLNEVIQLGAKLFELGSYRQLSPYFAGIMVFLSGIITVGLAFIEIVIAKMMLAITLATAPLFIIFLLFDQTKSFFERWLSIVVGFALSLILVSSVVGLALHLLNWVFQNMNQGESLTTAVWVPLFIVSILCVMSILEAASIGKSIGGAVSTSGGASMVGGFIGGALGAQSLGKKTLSAFKNPAHHGLKVYQSLRRGK